MLWYFLKDFMYYHTNANFYNQSLTGSGFVMEGDLSPLPYYLMSRKTRLVKVKYLDNQVLRYLIQLKGHEHFSSTIWHLDT